MVWIRCSACRNKSSDFVCEVKRGLDVDIMLRETDPLLPAGGVGVDAAAFCCVEEKQKLALSDP